MVPCMYPITEKIKTSIIIIIINMTIPISYIGGNRRINKQNILISTLSSNVNSKDFYAHRSYTPHFNHHEKWIQKSGVW